MCPCAQRSLPPWSNVPYVLPCVLMPPMVLAVACWCFYAADALGGELTLHVPFDCMHVVVRVVYYLLLIFGLLQTLWIAR